MVRQILFRVHQILYAPLVPYSEGAAVRKGEEIGWLKAAFGIPVALDASLVARLAVLVIGVMIVLIMLVIGVMIVLINRRAYKRIEELEKV